MADAPKHKKSDELQEKARQLLRRKSWFEAEHVALKALTMARQQQDFEQMAGLVPILEEARRERLQEALSVGKVVVIDSPVTEDMKVKRGCYLVQPPQVGLDARRLRLAGLMQDVPVAVVCREPLTMLKQTPVVAISPNTTLRAKVDSPPRPNSPSMAWFISAMRALGDRAIEALDTTMPVIRRIDAIMDFLDALPEHDHLHHALEAACREAHQTKAREKSTGPKKAKIKS